MLSRISNLGGGKFEEIAFSNLEFLGFGKYGVDPKSRISNLGGGKFGVENAISNVENLGWKMLSRISNLGGGKFGVENAISNLQFGGWKIWDAKCSNLEFGGWKVGVENAISNVENLGWVELSRISNLGGGKFGVENAISKFLIWGGWNIWGGKCYLESPIWVGGKFGVENVSNLEFGG